MRRCRLDPSPWFAAANALEERPKPGKLMHKPGEGPMLAEGLHKFGVLRAVPPSSVPHVEGPPLVNTWFGAGKDHFLNDCSEVLRLIMSMSMTSSNLLFKGMRGEVNLMPVFTLVRFIVLLSSGKECAANRSDELAEPVLICECAGGTCTLLAADCCDLCGHLVCYAHQSITPPFPGSPGPDL